VVLEKDGEYQLNGSCEKKVLHTVEKERTFEIQLNEARLTGLVTSYVQTAV